MIDHIVPKGYIQARIKHKNKGIETLTFKNQVLNTGKIFLAKCLLEEYKDTVHIANMLFGDGGTQNGTPKEVSPSAQNLNGVTRIKKPVVAQINPDSPMEAIFVVIISEDEGNDFITNEMGLELSDGSLFSLSTFADLNKTDQMEITWSWNISFL
jgi:hypothetical protein